jgi:hypothetical protein
MSKKVDTATMTLETYAAILEYLALQPYIDVHAMMWELEMNVIIEQHIPHNVVPIVPDEELEDEYE